MANLIFDLDGTLADSLPLIIEVANGLAIVNHEITLAHYEEVKNLPTRAILKKLGIPLWRAPALATKGRAALAGRITEVALFPGLAPVLAKFAANGHRLFVVSSNSAANVEQFLAHHQINQYFEKVYGGVGIFSKASLLRKITRAEQLDPAQTFYIGDETRDVEAAKRAGLQAVAVTWGFNGREILGSLEPAFLVDKPSQLAKIVRTQR